jgi:hypothetical protein
MAAIDRSNMQRAMPSPCGGADFRTRGKGGLNALKLSPCPGRKQHWVILSTSNTRLIAERCHTAWVLCHRKKSDACLREAAPVNPFASIAC